MSESSISPTLYSVSSPVITRTTSAQIATKPPAPFWIEGALICNTVCLYHQEIDVSQTALY